MVALARVAEAAPPLSSLAEAAIDRKHLARMTLGEAGLEREVLALFDRQAEMLLPRMRRVAPDAALALAHTLKGSARGVGAWRVAAAAEAVERSSSDTLSSTIDALDQAVAEAKAAIGCLLNGH
jgi:hypothetical protein